MGRAAPVRRTSRLLIISEGAGSVTPEIREKLVSAFPSHRVIPFNAKKDFRLEITPAATVVVAGGDGTIGFVARALAMSRRHLGVISLGTFNNFALSLGIPSDVDKAIAVIKAGKTRPVTLGAVGGNAFLELAAIGMFGAAILLGDKAKDKEFGSLSHDLRAVTGAKPFEYTLSGDVEGTGSALSLVCTNTTSTGAGMPMGRKKPTEPYLELSPMAGATRRDILGRAIAAAVLSKREEDRGMSLRIRTLTVETKPRVNVYADNVRVGRTPITIKAHPGALQMIVP